MTSIGEFGETPKCFYLAKHAVIIYYTSIIGGCLK